MALASEIGKLMKQSADLIREYDDAVKALLVAIDSEDQDHIGTAVERLRNIYDRRLEAA